MHNKEATLVLQVQNINDFNGVSKQNNFNGYLFKQLSISSVLFFANSISIKIFCKNDNIR